MPIITNVYVDGFNLYYGAVKRTQHKWLDIATLCRRMFPKVAIKRIRYFTALVNGSVDPQAPLRQQIYLRALQTIPELSIHYGFFLTKPVRARVAHPPPATIEILKTEEKGSDVNLAAYLLCDAFDGDYEQAIVISNDSDLCEPIRLVQQKFRLPVGFVNPHCHHRPASELKKVATFWRHLRPGWLGPAQFPNDLKDAKGAFSKPAAW